MSASKRLQRSTQNRFIGGVCAGIAEYLNIDAVLVRLFFVLLVLFGGSGVLLYVILWIVMPSEQKAYYDNLMREYQTKNMAQGETLETEIPSQTNDFTAQLVIGLTFIVAGLVFLALIFLPRFNFVDLCFVGLTILGVLLVITSFKSKKNEKQ